jgi:hypothetical protein
MRVPAAEGKCLVSEDKTIEPQNEISRRDSIKRGALAGAALWSTPVIRAVNLGGKHNPPPKSPSGGGHDISYIAMNVVKHGKKFTIKWEVDGNYWDPSPGYFPSCGGVFWPRGWKVSGASLGFVASAPNSSTGCITVTVPSGYYVISSASKGALDCCAGPTGSGNLVFCPC